MQAQPQPRPTLAVPASLHLWLKWPTSYVGKFFLVAFVANNIPLLVLACYLALRPGSLSQSTVFILVLIATLVGTLMGIMGIRALLAPILQAGTALTDYLDTRQPYTIPELPHDEAGLLVRNIAYAISKIENDQQKMLEESQRDFLTGLLNRRAADERLKSLARLHASGLTQICLAFVDIDGFKKFNDRYGHHVGDEVLKAVSKCLAHNLRSMDWVARWGGEEFLLALQTTPQGAAAALERLRKDVEQIRVTEAGQPLGVTVSIGYTQLHPNEDIKEAIKRADTATYAAKRAGRNKIEALMVIPAGHDDL